MSAIVMIITMIVLRDNDSLPVDVMDEMTDEETDEETLRESGSAPQYAAHWLAGSCGRLYRKVTMGPVVALEDALACGPVTLIEHAQTLTCT
jgi:hypothetical protein